MVALARDGVRATADDQWQIGETLRVFSDGYAWVSLLPEDRYDAPLMSAELDETNTASEDALVRALLASVATYTVSALGFGVQIGDEYAGVMPDDDDGDGKPRRLPVSESEAAGLYASALNALLDDLLAPVEAR
ncbi:MAG: hypothetical protein JWN27_2951 [Candidatus Eremiobacteraeota bacterium]|nr:hypothetical protein [Candidatus Eremiobacteraeota bacterium]